MALFNLGTLGHISILQIIYLLSQLQGVKINYNTTSSKWAWPRVLSKPSWRQTVTRARLVPGLRQPSLPLHVPTRHFSASWPRPSSLLYLPDQKRAYVCCLFLKKSSPQDIVFDLRERQKHRCERETRSGISRLPPICTLTRDDPSTFWWWMVLQPPEPPSQGFMLPLCSFLVLCKLIHIENDVCFPLSRELYFSPTKGSDSLIFTKWLVNEISCLIPLFWFCLFWTP